MPNSTTSTVRTREFTRTLVGWIIVIGHLVLIVTVVSHGYMSSDQSRKILLTLGPIATAYFVSVVKGFISSPEKIKSVTEVNTNFFLISILLPLIFIVAIFSLVVSYPSEFVSNSDALQQWIAALEIALGGSVGLVVDDLFPKRN